MRWLPSPRMNFRCHTTFLKDIWVRFWLVVLTCFNTFLNQFKTMIQIFDQDVSNGEIFGCYSEAFFAPTNRLHFLRSMSHGGLMPHQVQPMFVATDFWGWIWIRIIWDHYFSVCVEKIQVMFLKRTCRSISPHQFKMFLPDWPGGWSLASLGRARVRRPRNPGWSLNGSAVS